MKKIFRVLLVLTLMTVLDYARTDSVVLAQTVVKDTGNVKKPAFGKLYFSKRDSGLYVYVGRYKNLIPPPFSTGEGSQGKPPVVVVPPVLPKEVMKKVADWTDKETGLHMDIEAYFLDNKWWLVRNFDNGAEYAISGRNILNDRYKISNLDAGFGQLSLTYIPETNLNGLFSYDGFPVVEFLKVKAGYLYKEGVFYRSGVLDSARTDKVLDSARTDNGSARTSGGGFGMAVILSYWNGFTRDIGNCDNCNEAGYNTLANEPARNRYGLTLFNQKAPHWGSYHNPKQIVVTDFRDGKYVNVDAVTDIDLNYTQASMDKDLEYVAAAGLKAFNFFLYDKDAVISEHSRYYLSSRSPYKEKVQYAYTVNNLNKRMVDNIAQEMGTKYYYKYQGRPVVWVNELEGSQFSTERYILASGAHWVVEPTESYWKENEGYTGPVRLEPAEGYVRCNGDVKRRVFVDLLRQKVPNVYLINDNTWYYGDVPAGFDAVGSYTAPSNCGGRPCTQAEHVAAQKAELERKLSTGVTVVPTVTLGFQNMWIFKGANPLMEVATAADVKGQFGMIEDLAKRYADRVPFVNVYSYGELLECGEWALAPRRNRDGSIDDSKLKVLKSIIGK